MFLHTWKLGNRSIANEEQARSVAQTSAKPTVKQLTRRHASTHTCRLFVNTHYWCL